MAKKITITITGIMILAFLSSCGIYAPSDARKVSPNSKERVKKNLEEGKGISLGKMMDGSGGTNYQFASSNPMWRATLEILDFLPLTNVDYSGGIITTDWYNEGTSLDESIKITVRFLTNEIRSDAISVKIFKKDCSTVETCKVSAIENNLNTEIKLAILKKATIMEKEGFERYYEKEGKNKAGILEKKQ